MLTSEERRTGFQFLVYSDNEFQCKIFNPTDPDYDDDLVCINACEDNEDIDEDIIIFENRKDIELFIALLQDAANRVWPVKVGTKTKKK